MFDKPLKHESFGTICVSRVSGHAKLFRSPHKHQHFMRLEIKEAELHRNLSRDWVFPRQSLIEIYLSDSQWANMVSSAGIGEGTPCTINFKTDGKGVQCEPPPETENARSTFSKEAEERGRKALEGMKSAMARLTELVEKGKAGKKELAEVNAMIDHAYMQGTSNFGFVMSQFEEYLDTLVMEAKTEVEAYGMNTVRSIGLSAIAENISPEQRQKMIDSLVAPTLQGIEDKKDE